MDTDKWSFSKLSVKNIVFDASERINSYYTVFFLIMSSLAVAYKTYVISPMECYMSNTQSGSNLQAFVMNYCWVKGTSVLFQNSTPPNKRRWDEQPSINYYPWVPLILLLQALLFYLPYAIWREYCTSKCGNLKNYMEKVVDSSKSSTKEDYDNSVQHICDEMEAILFMSRDFNHNYWAKFKRKINRKFKFLISNKRQGNRLVVIYMFVKLFIILNCILQIILMIKFLNIDHDFFAIYYYVFDHIFNGREWKESKYFPRVSFCRISGVRSVGNMLNDFVAQCVLSVNILNEKLYIFLFLWTGILFVLSLIYFAIYVYSTFVRCHRVKFVKKYLKMKDAYKKYECNLVEKFVDDFMRLDGCLLLKIIRCNAGEVITAEIIVKLWKSFKEKYRQMDFSNDQVNDRQSMSLKLEPGDTMSSLKYKNPSAPKKEVFM